MSYRPRIWAGVIVLSVLAALLIWQGSFSFGPYLPQTPAQTYVFWGLSTLNFLLTVLVGFMLFRDVIKLYVARRSGQEGSRIRTKIVVGAMLLSLVPAFFLVVWSVNVLNRTLDKWFSLPAEGIRDNLVEINKALERESQDKAQALALWLSESRLVERVVNEGPPADGSLADICNQTGIVEAFVRRKDGGQIMLCTGPGQPPLEPQRAGPGREIEKQAPLASGGSVVVRLRMAVDIARGHQQIDESVRRYNDLTLSRREMRNFYSLLLLLITLFILFIALWVALFLARQITTPISALLEAARAVRAGNLSYRVKTDAIDEFATLVRSFNEMTQDLDLNRQELDRRRRFIEAVLESIPSGVISLAYDGRIQLVNRALGTLIAEESIGSAQKLSDLLPPELQPEFSRLLKRARRTGIANRQLEMPGPRGPRQVSVTAAALDHKVTSGFVLVFEDTSEILFAQRTAAWHEVARRIAHELKNPLTPIALCSERIVRQLERIDGPPEVKRILTECSATIGREVESVKNLVNEFSQFARFPAAHPVPGDLNEVVEDALAVFAGRLEGVTIRKDLARPLPAVAVDREQFKRVVVNLVDNAAEAMQEMPLRQLNISTCAPSPDVVELVVADTGPGIKSEDKEKLFLPYFSTKRRGTGVGLAIVSHIVGEHKAQIRVEDNVPQGARFIIEMPVEVTPA